MTPTEASDPENDVEVFHNVNKDYLQPPPKPRFKVGDQVRISRIKEKFEKGYEPNFTYEVFKIAKVKETNPVTYSLVDYNGEPIEGGFYDKNLKTKVPELL